jgi:hypothetical protein
VTLTTAGTVFTARKVRRCKGAARPVAAHKGGAGRG